MSGRMSSIIDAISQGTIDDVKFFVEERGADVSVGFDLCGSPLHVLVMGTRPDVEKLKYLVAHGADVNATTKNGMSALHFYLRQDYANAEFLECLLSLGADVNAKDDKGSTPLHECAGRKKVNMEMLRCLILHGADVNAKMKINIEYCQGWTPLDSALNSPEVEKFLISLGAESGRKANNTGGNSGGGCLVLFAILGAASAFGICGVALFAAF